MFSICNCLSASYKVLELNEKNLLESVQTLSSFPWGNGLNYTGSNMEFSIVSILGGIPNLTGQDPEQPAVADSALTMGSDWMITRGPCQPQPF